MFGDQRRRRPPKGTAVAAGLVLILSGSLSACSAGSRLTSGGRATARPSNPAVEPLAEFRDRLDAYAKLHRSAVLSLASIHEGLSVTELWAREDLVADTIRARRRSAQQGDLFTAAVRPVLVTMVRTYLSSPEGAAARDRIVRDNPAAETPLIPVALKVNGRYAHGAAFSMMPPTLLMRLPPLPEEVEYRFYGKHLLLRDVSADIILDYILNVAP